MDSNDFSTLEAHDGFYLTIDKADGTISCWKSVERSLGFKAQGLFIMALFFAFILLFLYFTAMLLVQGEYLGLIFTVPMALIGLVLFAVVFDAFVAQWLPGRWKLKIRDGKSVLAVFFVSRHSLAVPLSPAVRKRTVRYGDQVWYIELQNAHGRLVSFGPPFGTKKVYEFHAALCEAVRKLDD